MKIGLKLTISHIAMALVPTVIMAVGVLFLVNDKLSEMGNQAREEGLNVVMASAEDALVESVSDKLDVVHKKKQQDVENLIQGMFQDLDYLTKAPQVYQLFENVKFYHDFGGIDDEGNIKVDTETYATIYNEERRFF